MNALPASGSGERERADFAKSYLPRLSSEYYRGRAFVHWTFTVENRATGWLTPEFHHFWRECLVHASARYGLASPIYVLMPDHAHLLWTGLDADSDQRLAVEFFRRTLQPKLHPATWQKQAHDHVLRENERAEGALDTIAYYIVQNPVRGGLVTDWKLWPFVGCTVVGYPTLDVRAEEYWSLFWRIYYRLLSRQSSARSRSPLPNDEAEQQ